MIGIPVQWTRQPSESSANINPRAKILIKKLVICAKY